MDPLLAACIGIFLTSLAGLMVSVFDGHENALVLMFFCLAFSVAVMFLVRWG